MTAAHSRVYHMELPLSIIVLARGG